MSNLEQLIQEQIPNIPIQVRNYLHSDAYPRIMREVVESFGLHMDEAAQVEIETTLLLIGLSRPNEYQKRLEEIGVTKEQAQALVETMNEKVFKPLVDSYKTPPTYTNALADNVLEEKSEIQAQEGVNQVQEEKHIEKKYAIDPYREPIE